ncbi:MAG: Rrf2 family transcriptional regulator [Bacteroidia bacterium]|nr:Rrf2 family transcriptional regulator [Bacteroidia bacterium]
MLSKKSKYAIKALVALARDYGHGPVLISKIADTERIPQKFLEAILIELKKIGILGSKKGAGGGYYLIKSPKEIMLSNVLRLTGGPIALTPCASLNFYERCEECIEESTCSLRDVAIDVRDVTLKILSNTNLNEMLIRENNLKKKFKKSFVNDKKVGRS